MKTNFIIAVLIYLERRKTRTFVGKLTMDQEKNVTTFYFQYDEKYLKRKYAIPLGPELPLSEKFYEAINLFPSFQDRIPAKENPAYVDYCREAGISSQENNPLVLLSTIGKRGPSSFVFEPVYEKQFTVNDLISYRENLGLTIREFASLFSISASHLQRIEANKFPGKDILKLIEIYKEHPLVALEEIKKNSGAIYTEKYQKILNLLQHKIKPNTNLEMNGMKLDSLREDEVMYTLEIKKKLEKLENLSSKNSIKNLLSDKKIIQTCSYVEGYSLAFTRMDKKPIIDELNPNEIPLIIKTASDEIWVYGRDNNGKAQLTQLHNKEVNIPFSNEKMFISLIDTKRPEIYYILLNGQHYVHFHQEAIINIKARFFEIRFAYAIYQSGLNAEYEFKTGVGNKSIDFKVIGKKTKNNFLIELTSLRDSEIVKQNIKSSGNWVTYSSTSFGKSVNVNSPEEMEYIKVQQAILHKADKFPKIASGNYHIIIIDMRRVSGGIVDEIDYHHIAYGGEQLHDSNKRYFLSNKQENKDNERDLIKGVFEYTEIKDKIHAVGFVLENNYTHNEIKSKTKLFVNRTIVKEDEKKIFNTLFEKW